ncbi:CHS1 [Mytilus coruscus]|uniref:chitin synthase n=1 Tax=Mytilus coruscus TaxID=42192 RepID=A0A6J8CGM5_MYTCO|nr:CHS1 [Mytilus coruscus]
MSTTRENGDLATLSNLDNQEILLHLKERFNKERIYTYIGDVLIAVNPYKTIPNLYNAEQIDYSKIRDPPHIYWTAEESYTCLQRDRTNQCILVTGDSGAGKTESTKHILKHLTTRSTCKIPDLVNKLNRVNPLIELFGNASTTLNNNSSRFGKLIELSYEGSILIGGKVRTFVLEKSRVVQHKPRERNFHIFYAFFAGNDEQYLQEKYSLKTPSAYRIMVGDEKILHNDTSIFWSQKEKQRYGDRFSEGCKILREIDFNETEISGILDILAACLHLGNIKFEEVGDNTYGVKLVDGDDGENSLRRAMLLLGLDNTDEKVVSEIKDIFIKGPPICLRDQKTLKLLNEIQAADVRDSIVKALYSGVFKAIIDKINMSIKGSMDSTCERQLFLRILDISGFERLIENNSLEQLLINITNEKMHHYLQEQIFILENREYVNEEIFMAANIFRDNKPVIDLIFEEPGILSIMDDQTGISSSDGAKLVTEFNNIKLKKAGVYQCGDTESFTIDHYAGKVKYNASKFLEKNRGTVPEKMKEILIERSNNCIVREYFDSQDSISDNRHNQDKKKSEKKQRPKNSAASQYRKSLYCLVEFLKDGSPLFVRCIKSNDDQQARRFDEKVVLEQLKSAGMNDVIRIRRDGFQCRMPFENFMTKIGKTKVFMKGHALDKVMQKIKELIQNSQNSTTRSDDTIIQITSDTSDEGNQIEGNGNEKWIWDVFRNKERKFEGCVEVENFFLKLCRFIICVGLLVGIAAKGIATILIPLLLASQLNTEKVLILEGAEVCGTSYLLFKVFHHHSMTSGITFIMTSFTLPSILNILKQIDLAREPKSAEIHSHKFSIRLSRVIIAFIAMFIQCGVLVCMIVQPHIILSDKMSIQTQYTTQEKIFIVASLVGVSMGFCQNFLYFDFKISSSDSTSKGWRADVDEARPTINLKLCIIKVGIFLLMAHCLLPEMSWTLTEEHANLKDNFVDKSVKIFRQHKFMFIYIYCAIFASYESVLACKLNMQRISFFIPLTLVPLGCFCGVLGFCYKWSEDTNVFGIAVSCPSVDIDSISMWVGASVALWVSIIFLTWHVLFPTCIKMEQDQRLFSLPTRDSLFSSLGLLMKRKDESFDHKLFRHEKREIDEKEKEEDFKLDFNKGNTDENESFVNGKTRECEERKKKKKKDIPYIYICGTMWHETRQEMLQLLKSLFRLDRHLQKDLGEEGDDYFEQEIHIIFDDAFETDKIIRQRLPNDYVKRLVECMEEASTSISEDIMHWNNKRLTKRTTPYGGRLEWSMPFGTKMTIHLKDKNKIRPRKRWSQIMYMYYLLGYKMMGKNGEDSQRAEKTNEKHQYCRIDSILNELPKDKVNKAHNTFILALDGDVDFKPEAIHKLIHKMKKNEKVGAVCGRIHPIGSGLVVWYQQFEYAVGHWLQKATEHVFGCVLCCPGAFSLFRATALMDDNVMRKYTSPLLEARHFIQYEQGEDRWLCTLMLQQGWKIDYAASADAFTFVPMTFEEFFVQRRRWAPSTLANIIDLLSSWRVTTKLNDNISTLFVFYQFILLFSNLLGLGTVTLMITGSFNAVLKITLFQSYVVAVTPVAVFAIICMKCSNDKQISAAALLSTVYTLVMVIVTVGLFVNISAEKTYSPNVIFFVEILCIFLIAGFAHPKELMCLVHGFLYYLMVPSTFIFLTVYYMCNIHVVSWGTREKKTEEEAVSSAEATKSPTIAILTLVKEKTMRFINKQLLSGCKVEQQANGNETEPGTLPQIRVSPVPPTAPSCPEVSKDPNAWQAMKYLGPKEKENTEDSETQFWTDILKKYLHPLEEDKQKKKEIVTELKSLRNNVACGFLLINFLFATAIFQLQNNTDQLKNVYILNEYEPLSITFLLVFALVILL